jgi:hypothetical protein
LNKNSFNTVKSYKVIFVMVSLCREYNSEKNGIFFISSTCNLDLQQRLKAVCFIFIVFFFDKTPSKVRRIIVFAFFFCALRQFVF